MTGGTDPTRAGIEAIVDELADRLADPDRVAARMTDPDNARVYPGGIRQQSWSQLSLTDGDPALALLYSELAGTDPGYRRVAHAYLARAAAALTATAPGGLYAGPVAVAFAAACAVRRPGDYANLLGTIDRAIADWLPSRLRAEWQRIEAGRAGTTFEAYDVVGGMTGLGRYLLGRGSDSRPALTAILSYLAALTVPLTGEATHLPGWWVAHPPDRPAAVGTGNEDGHVNLGLAHGIPGPLALLALAWQHGVRVPGQEQAIAQIVEWLLDWRGTDEFGNYWPATLSASELATRPAQLPPARTAWCYGLPGVARALHLAGQALDQPEWTAVAVAAIRGMLGRPAEGHGADDAGLCHGWAGLLHITRLTGMDSGDRQLTEAATGLAAQVVERYDRQAPFGFRVTTPPVPGAVDLAGFLEGSAGVALALRSYLTGGRTATGWDAALLLC